MSVNVCASQFNQKSKLIDRARQHILNKKDHPTRM
jgi:hypothetical protein